VFATPASAGPLLPQPVAVRDVLGEVAFDQQMAVGVNVVLLVVVELGHALIQALHAVVLPVQVVQPVILNHAA
tara:strand:- start:312 stop:530 length:219 start_codon:yes stop_codon:yes gene_type:complete